MLPILKYIYTEFDGFLYVTHTDLRRRASVASKNKHTYFLSTIPLYLPLKISLYCLIIEYQNYNLNICISVSIESVFSKLVF